jgi:hypothetical protein
MKNNQTFPLSRSTQAAKIKPTLPAAAAAEAKVTKNGSQSTHDFSHFLSLS